jgi:putative DNA primase/helicase
LFERLKAEAVGILAWLVVGAVRYRRDGLEPPAEVAGLTNTYFKDQDALGLWLATCKPCNPSDGKLAVELLDNLHGFCKVEDLSLSGLDSAGAFGKKLKSKGVAQIRTNKGSRYGLLPENEFESGFEIGFEIVQK